jgi:hypothetical protein
MWKLFLHFAEKCLKIPCQLSQCLVMRVGATPFLCSVVSTYLPYFLYFIGFRIDDNMPTAAVVPKPVSQRLANSIITFSVTCQFFKLHFSGNWHVPIEPTAAFGMLVKILKRLAVSINSAYSHQKIL